MANNIHIIGGVNVSVDSDCENIEAIGCSDKVYSNTDNDKTSIRNDALTVSETAIEMNVAVTTPVYIPVTDGRANKEGNFTTTATEKIYYINTDGSSSAVNLVDTGITYTFVKTSAANTVTITPASGDIDGGLTYTLTAIRETVTVAFNGTDWYLI